jgi:Protein of unknown function (DUF2585)
MSARSRPWLVTVAVVAAAVALLRAEGRRWWCACGSPAPWAGDARGPHNSQHFLDPYSISHVAHGVLLYGLAWLVARRRPFAWRFCLAVAGECLFEVAENADAVIGRFRAATAAVGYEGDTVANSLGDILCSAAGVVLARRLGPWWSAALVVATELVLLAWIRDGLLLNVVMMVHPVDAVRAWQAGH